MCLEVNVRLRERRLIFAGHCWRCDVPHGVQTPGNHTYYVKMLLEDFGGEKVKKKDLASAILQIKYAMRDRKGWKKAVKSICK